MSEVSKTARVGDVGEHVLIAEITGDLVKGSPHSLESATMLP